MIFSFSSSLHPVSIDVVDPGKERLMKFELELEDEEGVEEKRGLKDERYSLVDKGLVVFSLLMEEEVEGQVKRIDRLVEREFVVVGFVAI